MPSKTTLQKLSPGEAELLEIFWQQGPLTLSRLHEIYTDGTGKPTPQTIQTRLNRMVAKQLLVRNDEFPAVYRSAVSREKTQGKFIDLLENLADRYFAPLILRLAEKRSLTPEEVEAMKLAVDGQQKMRNEK